MKREKLLKWFAAFFAAMLVLAFCQRRQIPSVLQRYWRRSVNQLISHVVSEQENRKYKGDACFVQEGIKIAQVHVKAGEAVKKDSC